RPTPSASTTDKLAHALKARDDGDLVTAKKEFEELLAATPANAEVQRYLAEVNAKIAATPALVAKAKEAEEKMAKAAAEKIEKEKQAAQQQEQKKAKADAEQIEKEKQAAQQQEQRRLNGIAAVASKDAKAKAGAGDFTG